MEPSYSTEEQVFIETAYKVVCSVAQTAGVRFLAHIDNAFFRVHIKMDNELGAKAHVVREFYDGVTSSRETMIGGKLVIQSPNRQTDGLDTAYWIGATIRLLSDGEIDPALTALCRQSWGAHTDYMRRFEASLE